MKSKITHSVLIQDKQALESKELDLIRSAVIKFADKMYSKLKKKMQEGEAGWDSVEWFKNGQWLKNLEHHINKARNTGFLNADNIDIANYLMFKNEFNKKRM